MTLERTAESAAARPPRLGWERLPARVVGWLLLASCVALVVAIACVGERSASYAGLRAALAHHDVDEVRLTGALGAPYRGHLVVEAHWRTWSGGHVARVVEAHPRSAGERAAARQGLALVGSVEDDLSGRDPDVRIVEEDGWSATTEVLGWRLPEWVRDLPLLIMLGVLAALLAGPPTWRMTKWAWFWWLFLVPPIGVPAFLLLGGPTGLWPPPTLVGRARGGWAFLLALVASVALSAVTAGLA